MMKWLRTLQIHDFYSTAHRLEDAKSAELASASGSRSDVLPPVKANRTDDSLTASVNISDSQVDPSVTGDFANTAHSLLDPENTADSIVDPDTSSNSQVNSSDTDDFSTALCSLAASTHTTDSQINPVNSSDALVDICNTGDSDNTNHITS